jgi:hypothetical protein
VHISNYNAGQGNIFPTKPPHKAHKSLVTKPERKRLFGRHKKRQEGNIKIDLKEIGNKGCGLNSYGSGYDPLAGSKSVSYITGKHLHSVPFSTTIAYSAVPM